MNKNVAIAIIFFFVLGCARAVGYDCQRPENRPADAPDLQALYNEAPKTQEFKGLEFAVKYTENPSEWAKSYSIFKYSLKQKPSPFTDYTYPDGSVDFGVLDCLIAEDNLYIKRLHLLKEEFMPEAKAPKTFTFSVSNGKLDVPSFEVREELVRPSDRPNKKRKITYETMHGPFVDIPTSDGKTRTVSAHYLICDDITAVNEDFNIHSLIYDFNPLIIRWSQYKGNRMGVFAEDITKIDSASWTKFAKLKNTQRLDVYIKMAEFLEKLDSFGYVAPNLSVLDWATRGNDYIFTNPNDIQGIDELPKPLVLSIMADPTQIKSNGRITRFSQAYSFAMQILMMEKGSISPSSYTSIGQKRLNLREWNNENKQELKKEILEGLIEQNVAKNWGNIDKSISTEAGATLSSVVYSILVGLSQDWNIVRLKKFLIELRGRTNDRIIL